MKTILDEKLFAFLAEQESQFLIKPSHSVDEVKLRIKHEGVNHGDKLPWSKTNKNIRLRPCEVSMWAGVNGQGKSGFLGQVAAWGLDKKWLIASMEMTPAATLERMVKQMAGCDNPSDNFTEQTLKWMDDRLWIYDQTDSVKTERILALVRYAATLNVNHVVIDSLVKCGIGSDDYSTQTRFVDRLCWLAKTHQLHIHLVHHMRKGDDEKKIPNKYSVKGAGELVDLIDNLFIIHRNLKKESDPEKYVDEPDVWFRTAKQRHYAWEGLYGLWFDKLSNQYVADPNRTMTHWFNH